MEKNHDLPRDIKRRKKLWEIPTAFHCSLMGTCLSSEDMAELRKKMGGALQQALTTYQLHTALIDLSGNCTEASKTLQSFLDKRYHAAILRYMRLKNDADLEQQWRNDLFRGAMRGPYWAIMTHPAPSVELLSKIYGHLHMLGYESLFCTVRQRMELREQRERADIMARKLRERRRESSERECELNREINMLRQKISESQRLAHENDILRQELERLRLDSVQAAWRHEAEEMRQRLAEAQRHEAELDERLRTLSERALYQDSLLEMADREMRTLEQQVNTGTDGWTDSGDMNTRPAPAAEAACGACEEQRLGLCPGPALCGRTILYVGGQHKMIPHYRELIEERGGVFLHHDGGTENSHQRLPRMICQADAVFCPVDCVSHLACTCVKKLCKRQRKPFVMMRSSGLSHLTSSLERIGDMSGGDGHHMPQ